MPRLRSTDESTTGLSAEEAYVVTGASSGIGFAIARRLIDAGEKVIALCGPGSQLRAEAQELGASGRCTCITADLADLVELQQVLAQLANRPASGLVHAAAVAALGPLETSNLNELSAAFRLNVLAGIALAQAVLPGMRERRGGVILNISSGAAVCPLAFAGAYAATKGAIEAASLALAQEVGMFGVRVMLLRLGKVTGTRFGRKPFEGRIAGAYSSVWETTSTKLYPTLWPKDSAWLTPERVAVEATEMLRNPQEYSAIHELGADLSAMHMQRKLVEAMSCR